MGSRVPSLVSPTLRAPRKIDWKRVMKISRRISGGKSSIVAEAALAEGDMWRKCSPAGRGIAFGTDGDDNECYDLDLVCMLDIHLVGLSEDWFSSESRAHAACRNSSEMKYIRIGSIVLVIKYSIPIRLSPGSGGCFSGRFELQFPHGPLDHYKRQVLGPPSQRYLPAVCRGRRSVEEASVVRTASR